MLRYENYLFDLDGTLTDPGLGIQNSIRYALDKQGLPSLDEETLNLFVGPPLLDSFMRYCGVTEEEARILLSYYREYFTEKGIFENRLYVDTPELLSDLRDRGAHLFLASSKPEPFAKQILEHFGLLPLFEFVGGSTLDEQRTDKGDVIAYVLENTGIDPKKTVMIGDRKYDIAGGKRHGLDTVGVLFGYGAREELTESGATYLIADIDELLTL